MSKIENIQTLCVKSRDASRIIGAMGENEKRGILKSISDGLISEKNEIIIQNKKDLKSAEESGLSTAMIDRLMLNDERIDKMASSVMEISSLPEMIGRVEKMITRPSGIRVGQMRVPLGVFAVIYESRPNVTVDIAALAVKSGNAAILRGGKEAINTNIALYRIIQSAMKNCSAHPDIITLIEDTDRELVTILLKMDKYIDLVIPRGGKGLIDAVTSESTIPIIKHDKGVCHVFIDKSADKEMASSISINAKVQRPGVCNAMETLLIHSEFPDKLFVLQSLIDKGVTIHGCEKTKKILPEAVLATEEDYYMEYLDLNLTVKIVSSMKEAIDHIHKYASGHSEAIITNDYSNSEFFLRNVDSAAVLVNASTRFHDGGEFGLGTEVGISTQKLHARGAMGIEGLTCLKYIVYGSGQVRS